jgi:hypothetical protein
MLHMLHMLQVFQMNVGMLQAFFQNVSSVSVVCL